MKEDINNKYKNTLARHINNYLQIKCAGDWNERPIDFDQHAQFREIENAICESLSWLTQELLSYQETWDSRFSYLDGVLLSNITCHNISSITLEGAVYVVNGKNTTIMEPIQAHLTIGNKESLKDYRICFGYMNRDGVQHSNSFRIDKLPFPSQAQDWTFVFSDTS